MTEQPSRLDEIRKHNALDDFPCPDGRDMRSVQCIAAECPYVPPDGCALRPIYEEYLALRAVVEAVLSHTAEPGTTDLTQELATMRSYGDEYWANIADKVKALT